MSATSGAEALRLLLERDFGLILLDVRMPGLDGLETARMIKNRPRTRDVPIVFLTAARDEVRDIIRGYGVGAVDYVLKPFDPELLRSKVAVFAELEDSRRALKHSEAFLRGAFESAPIGKTVLDGERRQRRVLHQAQIDLPPRHGDVLDTHLDLVAERERAAVALSRQPLRRLVIFVAVVAQRRGLDQTLDERRLDLHEQAEGLHACDGALELLAHAIAHEEGAIEIDDLALRFHRASLRR